MAGPYIQGGRRSTPLIPTMGHQEQMVHLLVVSLIQSRRSRVLLSLTDMALKELVISPSDKMFLLGRRARRGMASLTCPSLHSGILTGMDLP
jgi:hypothetical protein